MGAGEIIELPPSATTMPSVHDPENGLWMPRIALADGLWDQLEDILGKMGVGAVNSSGSFIGSSAAGHFDLYINGSGQHEDYTIDTLEHLVSDLEKMKQYHIIFVPCSDGDNTKLFFDSRLRENIRQYVALGGKFYVTDWSAEWEDVVFPEFIQFSPSHDTRADATENDFNGGNGSPPYTSEEARAIDLDLSAWIDGQNGPLVGSSYVDGTIDAKDFTVEGNWDHIQSLPKIEIGMDEEGLPVFEEAHVWVKGDWSAGEGPIHPLTVTFEPIGCGRVLYSTYHTAESEHVGLVPQERVLLYLLMEIGECKAGPVVID